MPRPLTKSSRRLALAAKRAVDRAGAACGLVATAPLIVAVAAAIRLEGGGPALFVQERAGQHGRTFRLVKFRTMRTSVGPDGQPLPDELRITRLGQFLRTTSIDELPQLWNVLRGDMSLVGPRPLLLEYLPRYSERQARRHDVPPGLTGWAQINGRNALGWEEKFELDVWYVENWRLLLDLEILLKTASSVVTRRGISNPGHVTMPVFGG
jgi:lipopolysaccharide/colanic/teichoic acid biosynthesis glycosyltransferase